METDETFRKHRQRQDRFHRQLEEIRAQTEAVLKGIEAQTPTAATAGQLERLRGELERLVQENLDQAGAFIEYVRKMEEANRRAAMVEKRPRPERSQAQIQQLSEELSTRLRLERVDGAIKELLEFLADASFFAANASIGRRRKLRSLQNALEKALQK